MRVRRAPRSRHAVASGRCRSDARRAGVALLLASVLLGAGWATAATDPLAGVVLDDDAGTSWRLDELQGAPVLLVVADRNASDQAHAWGERLAAYNLPLAPWRAADKVAWVAIADLHRVPDYARDAARERIRERDAQRGDQERRLSSPLLLDWDGRFAERFAVERGGVVLVMLAAEDRRELARERGMPTDEALARLAKVITDAVAR